jgi:F0F1-type ATP synthase assembly protein I
MEQPARAEDWGVIVYLILIVIGGISSALKKRREEKKGTSPIPEQSSQEPPLDPLRSFLEELAETSSPREAPGQDDYEEDYEEDIQSDVAASKQSEMAVVIAKRKEEQQTLAEKVPAMKLDEYSDAFSVPEENPLFEASPDVTLEPRRSAGGSGQTYSGSGYRARSLLSKGYTREMIVAMEILGQPIALRKSHDSI